VTRAGTPLALHSLRMSDASDKVAEAKARTMRLAAIRLARKEELEAELAKRKGDRAELSGMDQTDAVLALALDLDVRIQALAAEIATIEGELVAARREIGDLRKLGGQALVNEAQQIARSVTDPDPILRSPEEQALDNVREHIAGLEAQVRLGTELGSPEPVEPEPPAPPPGRPKKTL
jgi:hypothetical protein